MFDGSGAAEVLVGLDGFVVLDAVADAGGESTVTVETIVYSQACVECGVLPRPSEGFCCQSSARLVGGYPKKGR